MKRVTKNTLDKYLTKLGDINVEEVFLNHTVTTTESPDKKPWKFTTQLPETLENQDFDTHQHKTALALYDKEHPKPENISKTCTHKKTHYARQVMHDKSEHIVEQCLKCGQLIQYLPKGTIPEPHKLPEFDPDIGKKEREELALWYKERYAIEHSTYYLAEQEFLKEENDE